jgi:RNA polymerase sigma-70 factor, ECF subfamily
MQTAISESEPFRRPFPIVSGEVGVYSVLETTTLLPGARSDATLLARIAEGDLEAFQTFYGRHAGRVLAYARQLGRGADLVEDVVQEVFVAVWRRAASFRPDRGDPTGWLYTITRNKLVDHWRRQGETAEPGEIASLALAEEDSGDLRVTMRQALARVAPDQRRAIEMAYFGGLTYEETARRLDLPVGTLKSRIRSGLKTLRTLLESH